MAFEGDTVSSTGLRSEALKEFLRKLFPREVDDISVEKSATSAEYKLMLPRKLSDDEKELLNKFRAIDPDSD